MSAEGVVERMASNVETAAKAILAPADHIRAIRNFNAQARERNFDRSWSFLSSKGERHARSQKFARGAVHA
jgi:hypothetical protein